MGKLWTLSNLKERKIYSLSLTVDGSVQYNECLCTILNGTLYIHRASDWEEFESSDLREVAFKEDNTFKYNWHQIPCFTPMNLELS